MISTGFSLGRPARGCIRAAVLVAMLAPPAAAQFAYVRNLDFGNSLPTYIIPVVKSPVVPGQAGASNLQWLLATAGYGAFDPADGFVSYSTITGLGFGAGSEATITGGVFTVTGSRNSLVTLDPTTLAFSTATVSGIAPPTTASSLAASRSGALTAMSNAAVGYTISPTRTATVAFGNLGTGNGDGQFDNALYHIYGQNDLLYVLDYGNSRVQMLDPANGFAYTGQFALESGVTTANMQFAIGPDGTVYLGDGQGGGSAYSQYGTYLGSFSLPGDANQPVFSGGTPYVTTDDSGGVYVFDGTGFHQYENTATPEPSSLVLLATAGLIGVVVQTRRKRARLSAPAHLSATMRAGTQNAD